MASWVATNRWELLIDGLDIDTRRSLTKARQRTSLRIDLPLALAELPSAGGIAPEAAAEELDVSALGTEIASAARSGPAALHQRSVIYKRGRLLDEWRPSALGISNRTRGNPTIDSR